MGMQSWEVMAEMGAEIARLRVDAKRYRWIREHGAWETEAFLNGLTPAEYDAAVDKAMRDEQESGDILKD